MLEIIRFLPEIINFCRRYLSLSASPRTRFLLFGYDNVFMHKAESLPYPYPSVE
jgi:hypothetical protein